MDDIEDLPEVDINSLEVGPEDAGPPELDSNLAGLITAIREASSDNPQPPAPPPVPVQVHAPVAKAVTFSDDDRTKRLDKSLKQMEQIERLEDLKQKREKRKANDTAEFVERVVNKTLEAKKLAETIEKEGKEVEMYIRYWRMYCRFKDEMGLAGSSKRMTFGQARLEQLIEETMMQRQQACERRANGKLTGIINYAVGRLETIVAAMFPKGVIDLTGLEDDWAEMRKEDPGLNDAMLQLEIENSHMFAMSPKYYVGYAILRAANKRATDNRNALVKRASETATRRAAQPSFDTSDL